MVITITPLPPFTPYIEAKAASFKTFTDLTSFGFKEFRSSIVADIPSTVSYTHLTLPTNREV